MLHVSHRRKANAERYRHQSSAIGPSVAYAPFTGGSRGGGFPVICSGQYGHVPIWSRPNTWTALAIFRLFQLQGPIFGAMMHIWSSSVSL